MPSPIGHGLAGVVAAWTIDLVPGDRRQRTAPADANWFARAGDGLTLVCAALGALPDVDLLFHDHRQFTHSVTAVVLVAIIAAAVTGRVTRASTSRARVMTMCAAAYGTHLLLDWMAVDTFFPYGIELLWPFSSHWFISGWDIFRQTERRRILSAAAMRINLLAAAEETAILLPIAVAVWLVRVKALAGLAPEVSRGDHPAQ